MSAATVYRHAIARRPGRDFHLGITRAGAPAPDYERCLAQHAAYVEALADAGLEVTVLDPLPGFPDAHFVEDTAVVAGGIAVLANPGAESRKGEVAGVEAALARHLPLARIEPPGTLDGGDVLVVGRMVAVGLSERTNPAGAEQLGRLLAPRGYQLVTVPVSEALHLKSGINWLGDETVIATPAYAGLEAFAALGKVVLAPGEEYAGNCLWVNGRVLFPAGFPDAAGKLREAGHRVVELDTSEFARMDGGLTCLSLRIP